MLLQLGISRHARIFRGCHRRAHGRPALRADQRSTETRHLQSAHPDHGAVPHDLRALHRQAHVRFRGAFFALQHTPSPRRSHLRPPRNDRRAATVAAAEQNFGTSKLASLMSGNASVQKAHALHDIRLWDRPDVVKRIASNEREVRFGVAHHLHMSRIDHHDAYDPIMISSLPRLQQDHVIQSNAAQTSKECVAIPRERDVARAPRSCSSGMCPTAFRNVASSSPSAIMAESPMRGMEILPKGSPGFRARVGG